MKQKYVSKYLTHFVGRKKGNDEAQFKVLLDILGSGELKSEMHQDSVNSYTTINPTAKVSKNAMHNIDMVCFCDIPLIYSGIHIEKYSSFGLSFSKRFIVSKGGVPVLYIPQKAAMLNQCITKSEYFDNMIPHYYKLFHLLIYNTEVREVLKAKYTALPDVVNCPQFAYPPYSDCQMDFVELLYKLYDLLEFHLLCNLKFYDHNLRDNHPENYYLEREWRILGKLKFTSRNVSGIIAPLKYQDRLLKAFPQYKQKLKAPPPLA